LLDTPFSPNHFVLLSSIPQSFCLLFLNKRTQCSPLSTTALFLQRKPTSNSPESFSFFLLVGFHIRDKALNGCHALDTQHIYNRKAIKCLKITFLQLLQTVLLAVLARSIENYFLLRNTAILFVVCYTRKKKKLTLMSCHNSFKFYTIFF